MASNLEASNSKTLNTILEIVNYNGFILLNENEKYPSVCGSGGSWSDVVALIKTRQAMLTKCIDNKSAFISSKLFDELRRKQKPLNLNDEVLAFYNFIKTNQPVSTNFIKQSAIVSEKRVRPLLDKLLKDMMVTAVDEERRISGSWGTFMWGTTDHYFEKQSQA